MEQLTIDLLYTEVDGVRFYDTEEMIRQLHVKIAAVEKLRDFSYNNWLVVDTWNGDDMYGNNGNNISRFDCALPARDYAKELSEEEVENSEFDSDDIEYRENQDLLDTQVFSYVYPFGDGQGTYQVHKMNDDIYAVKILCNINEVELLTKEEYDNDPDNDGSDFVDDGQYYIKFVLLDDNQKPQ